MLHEFLEYGPRFLHVVFVLGVRGPDRVQIADELVEDRSRAVMIVPWLPAFGTTYPPKTRTLQGRLGAFMQAFWLVLDELDVLQRQAADRPSGRGEVGISPCDARTSNSVCIFDWKSVLIYFQNRVFKIKLI